MALTAVATKVLTLSPFAPDSGCYGVMSQADGSYIAGNSYAGTSFPFPTFSDWYRSTNDGLNWTFTGSSSGMIGQFITFPTNLSMNQVLSGAEFPADGHVEILRSANGGANWGSVFSASIAASPNGRFVFISGLQSYNIDNCVAYGALDGDATNPPALWALSTDNGASFAVQSPFDTGNFDDGADAMAIGENGNWWMAYIKFGGVNRESWLARTTNGGASWTPQIRLRKTDGTGFIFTSAICAVHEENILLGGTNSLTPTSSVPSLWWSDDGGATLTAVPGADILNWPTGSFYSNTREIKRLTRDAVFLAFEQQNGTPGCPWRISQDMGHTFDIEVSRAGGSWPSFVIPMGKAVVTRSGAILAMTWESNDYTTIEHCIYRIALDC